MLIKLGAIGEVLHKADNNRGSDTARLRGIGKARQRATEVVEEGWGGWGGGGGGE